MTTVYPGGNVPFLFGSLDEYGKPAVSFIQVTGMLCYVLLLPSIFPFFPAFHFFIPFTPLPSPFPLPITPPSLNTSLSPPSPFLQLRPLSTSRSPEIEFQPQVVIHEPKDNILTFTYSIKAADNVKDRHILSQVEYPVRDLVSQ